MASNAPPTANADAANPATAEILSPGIATSSAPKSPRTSSVAGTSSGAFSCMSTSPSVPATPPAAVPAPAVPPTGGSADSPASVVTAADPDAIPSHCSAALPKSTAKSSHQKDIWFRSSLSRICSPASSFPRRTTYNHLRVTCMQRACTSRLS